MYNSHVLEDLHPLAVEDVLPPFHGPRSKSDYFTQHLFLKVQCHTLLPDDDEEEAERSLHSVLTDMPRSTSPTEMYGHDMDTMKTDTSIQSMMTTGNGAVTDDEKTVQGTPPSSRFSTSRWRNKKMTKAEDDIEASAQPARRLTTTSPLKRTIDSRRQRDRMIIKELKRGEAVRLNRKPMCIFLLRDGR